MPGKAFRVMPKEREIKCVLFVIRIGFLDLGFFLDAVDQNWFF